MALFTRSSSSILTVLIQVIGTPPCPKHCDRIGRGNDAWSATAAANYVALKNQRPDGCASGRKCLGCLLGGESFLASLETMYVAPFIAVARNLGNNAKEL